MDRITELTRRVVALEKIVAPPKQERRRLNKRAVAEREGISTRSLDRHVVAGSFPAPMMINGRHFWWEHDLDAHDAALLQKAKQHS